MTYSYDHYEQDDGSFVSDLVESQASVWIVARWLSSLGYPVTVNPLRVRPDVSQMAAYADKGDIEIAQRVEVKRRPNILFTCAADFPYPTVIVDVCHTWDRARPKPFAYVILNSDATCAIIVKGESSDSWVKSSKYDRAKNRTRQFYECPIELCKFIRLDG
jgi:hypothetical protein